MPSLIDKANQFLNRPRLEFVRHIGVFLLILFGFHFFYNLVLRPLNQVEGMNFVWVFLQGLLYSHSTWAIKHILGYEIVRDGYLILFPALGEGAGGILVDETCSATKWLMHFLMLMLIFPGPWRHKLWFIPAGLVMVHLISVFRIVGLAVVYVNRPESWDLFHNYVFRPFFYAMLFMAWVFWVEFFVGKKKNNE